MDETIKNTTSKPKRKRLTKIVFYIMSILLLSTTCMCAYMTYKITNLKLNNNITSTNTNATEPTVNTSIPDGYTLINDDMLSELKNDGYYLGRDNILSSIKSMMENGSTTLKMLRSIYPEYLIYSEKGGYVFKEINHDLVKNDYNKESNG